jgi:gliding motility-associated lipoprotein GldH
MKRRFLAAFLTISLIMGCSGDRGQEVYYTFKDKIWYRFNNLSFELPVKRAGKSYDIVFFLRLTREFEYQTFEFNMVMNTPSGEERIREYHIDVKDREGKFFGKAEGDSITAQVFLRKEITFSREGTLRIEIENLIPRMKTYGILGAGVRLEPL